MVTDDLGDQRQAEATAGILRGDERLEQMRSYVFGNTMTIVPYRDEQRQVKALQTAGNGDTHTVLEAGGQHDLGVMHTLLGHRLGSVLDQVEHHLHQLVAIGPDRRQRRVIQLLEPDMCREA